MNRLISSSASACMGFLRSHQRLTLIFMAGFVIVGASRLATIQRSNPVETPLKKQIFALGRVQPAAYTRSIMLPMIYNSSRIKELYVDQNDYVLKGDPLFTVEESNDATYKMQKSKERIREQVSELKAAERIMHASKAVRDFYSKEMQRYNYLLSMGAASQVLADEKKTLFNAAEQRYQSDLELVRSNRSRLSALRWEYRSSEFKSEISTVRSPTNAMIFKIYSRAGESIQEGNPVMDIGEVESMAVMAEVHRIDIKNITLNQFATITANGMSEIKWKGKVAKISRQVSSQSIVSDDPAATRSNRVFSVLLKLSKAASLQAQKYNHMEVNVLFEPS